MKFRDPQPAFRTVNRGLREALEQVAEEATREIVGRVAALDIDAPAIRAAVKKELVHG